MAANLLSIFISYARTDSSFTDRLEADLQARNFYTWVDRRKLEGGQIWLDELEKAIERCHVLLVVLSPNSVKSENVRMEYRFAQKLGKPVIPLEYQACQRVPIDLNSLQWVSFLTGDYEQGLRDLLVALNRPEIITGQKAASPTQTPQISLTRQNREPDLVPPQPAPPAPDPDLRTLYLAGIKAKAEGNLDRTAVLWQQILDRDSHFQHDTLAPQMTRLQQELHRYRVNRLRERAKQAYKSGEWGQEIGAWQALLGMEPQDPSAQRSLTIAEHNQDYSWMYENAVQLKEEGKHLPAKLQLELLWEDAPLYGDPKAIAKSVGAQIPLPKLNNSYAGTFVQTDKERNTGKMLLTIKKILPPNTDGTEEIEAYIGLRSTINDYSVKGQLDINSTIQLQGTSTVNGTRIAIIGMITTSGQIEGEFFLLLQGGTTNKFTFSIQPKQA